MISRHLQAVRHFLGLPATAHPASEQVLATLGGVISIALVLALTQSWLGQSGAVLIVPSMGASAVLIFAVPHSLFAQPWAVFGGHVLSALVGVACQLLIPNPLLAAALAVGLAIGVMHAARCIHPPGGATALAAVIGGPAIHQLGFSYALLPVAINVLIMLAVGLIFNYAFAWRRYPLSLMRYAVHKPESRQLVLSEKQVRAAMERLNVVLDVSPAEINEIINQALLIAQREHAARLPNVEAGRFYCNDRPGQQWSVRQIVDERRSDNPDFDLVIYKVVDGNGLHRHGNCTRTEFAHWVGSELQPSKRR